MWYILEDNLRVPSGASYPTIARELERRCSPRTFHETPIEDNRDYPQLLKHVMDYVNTGGIGVWTALTLCVLPYIIPDVLKILGAYKLSQIVKKRVDL